MSKICNDVTETIAAIVPSSAERYLSAWLFADVDVNSDSLAGLIPAVA